MITITALPSRIIGVGRVGENEHRRVAFDISEYLAQYPDGTATGHEKEGIAIYGGHIYMGSHGYGLHVFEYN